MIVEYGLPRGSLSQTLALSNQIGGDTLAFRLYQVAGVRGTGLLTCRNPHTGLKTLESQDFALALASSALSLALPKYQNLLTDYNTGIRKPSGHRGPTGHH